MKSFGRSAYRYLASAHSRPKNSSRNLALKKSWGITGEDAFFITETKTHWALGVADGVGSWSQEGIDPSVFSGALMRHAHDYIIDRSKLYKDEYHEISVNSVLEYAYTCIVNDRSVIAGSSTACIATLSKRTGVLNSINLGDSGFILLRDNQRWHRSKTQQHRFNCPYQLTVIPDRRDLGFDMPSDGCIEQLGLLEGDLLVLATDGFWDNVFEHELTSKIESEMCDKSGDFEEKLWKCGEALVEMASDLARDPKRESPWAQGRRWKGGKVDDTTLILAAVLRS